jgi:hypothetical protein
MNANTTPLEAPKLRNNIPEVKGRETRTYQFMGLKLLLQRYDKRTDPTYDLI